MQRMNNNNISFPVRLNRYLYLQGFCSRREADRLIEKGLIKVNGKKAALGQQISETDTIDIPKSVRQEKSIKKYFILHKPEGVVSHNPQAGEKSADSYFESPDLRKLRLAPLGRLDKASRGLMLFSNDGTIVDKLLNPKFEHQKEYEVIVDKRIDKTFIQNMETGVVIEGYRTKPAQISKKDPRAFRIILTEGKKHQIRRMCAALGYQVQDLKRTRIMNLRLGKLKPGAYKEVTGLELLEFLKSIGAVMKKERKEG